MTSRRNIVIEGNPSTRTEFEVDEGCFGLQERGHGEAGEDVCFFHEMVASEGQGRQVITARDKKRLEECHSTRAVNGRACPRPYTKQEWEELRDQPASSGDSLIGQHVLQHSDGTTA